MPTYTIKVPDGRTVTAKAPDEATAMAGIQEWYRNNPKEASAGEKATDALISTGSGITKSFASLPSLPADIASGGRWLLEKAGASPEYIQRQRDILKENPITNSVLGASRAYREELENPTTEFTKGLKSYMDYKPETKLGEYGKTTGEFAAAALGNKKGVVERIGKYVVAPGVASEAAGQATEGTALEPYARLGAGLMGAVGGAAVGNKIGEVRAVKALDTAMDKLKSGTEAYEKAKQAGVLIKGNSLNNMAQGLENKLINQGFNAGTAPVAKAALDKVVGDLSKLKGRTVTTPGGLMGLGRPTTRQLPGKDARLEDLDQLISYVGGEVKTLSPLSPTYKRDMKYLYSLKSELDDYAQSLTNSDITAGNLALAKQALSKAKKDWKVKSKLELLDQLEENAQHTGRAVYTRGGVEHATRREFLKYIRKPKNKKQSLSTKELSAFENVADGGLYRNAMRGLGKLSGSTQSSIFNTGMASAAGHFLGGPIGAAVGAAVPASALVARLLSNRATQRAVNDARSIIVNGKKLKRGYKTPYGAPLVIRGLLEHDES